MFSFNQTIVIISLFVVCFQTYSSAPASELSHIIEGDKGVIKVDGKIISKMDNEFKRGRVHIRTTSKGLLCINKRRIFDLTDISPESFAKLKLDSKSVTAFRIKVNKNGQLGYTDDQGKIFFAQPAKVPKNQSGLIKDMLVGVDENIGPEDIKTYRPKNIKNTIIKGEGGQITVNGKLVVKRDYQFENGIVHLNIFNGVVRINGKKIFGKPITCPGKCTNMEMNRDEGVDGFVIEIMEDGTVDKVVIMGTPA
ncbi:uncharacterized protein LOC135849024 [Planococcus citri]|uniref:uncharacterized protein LOC135849024 n=1 Tax=Planococcus citri TaxID=170843 RepID=UPI0031F7979E